MTVPNDLIPEYLRTEIDEETEKLIKDQLDIEERVLSIKLKVHYKDEVKTLTYKKNDVLRDVAAKIMEEFNINDVTLKNFRLRAYDPKLKAKLAIYDYFDF